MSEPFPRPPQVVAAVFEDLTRVAMLTGMLGGRNDDENDLVQGELDQYGDRDLLPRPWDPPTCPPSVRGPLWKWLDDVAAWLNGDYAWGTDRCVPTCWPAHPTWYTSSRSWPACAGRPARPSPRTRSRSGTLGAALVRRQDARPAWPERVPTRQAHPLARSNPLPGLRQRTSARRAAGDLRPRHHRWPAHRHLTTVPAGDNGAAS